MYFGGGTPSLVPPQLVGTILAALEEKVGIASDAEITLEADPGTFDAARLAQYTDLGITRLSMGVQSFQQVHALATPLPVRLCCVMTFSHFLITV